MSAPTVEVEAPEAPASQRRRWPLLVVLVLVMLAGVGAGGWWWLAAEGGEPEEFEDGDVIDLEPMTATVGENGLRHVRVAMSIVLVDGVGPDEVRPRTALLRDELLQHVATTDADQIRTEEGSNALRRSLTDAAHDIWGEDTVRRVVLTELLVQ